MNTRPLVGLLTMPRSRGRGFLGLRQVLSTAAIVCVSTTGCSPTAREAEPALVVDIPYPVMNGGTSQLKFSPSGEELAAPFMDLEKGGRWRGFTRFYRVPDGRQVREIEGGWNCAWSPDGELFAVGRLARTGGLIDLWNAKTWTHLQQLTRDLPGSWEPSDFEQGSLCFDNEKNLYVATGPAIDDPVEWPGRHIVWWRHGGGYQDAEPIGTCATNPAMSISVASIGEGTRVALSYKYYKSGLPTCPVETLLVRTGKDGTKNVARENTVPAIPPEDEVWLQLTPDGSHLAALSGRAFWLIRLLPAKLIKASERGSGSGSYFENHLSLAGRNLDVSADGRLIAYVWAGDRLVVVRVADGATVAQLQSGGGVCALSPDGRLLAYVPTNVSPKLIRIVDISQIERAMK